MNGYSLSLSLSLSLSVCLDPFSSNTWLSLQQRVLFPLLLKEIPLEEGTITRVTFISLSGTAFFTCRVTTTNRCTDGFGCCYFRDIPVATD
jgi:hypothetical protein